MDKDKERQEISLIGRLFCLEALILLMGLFSLASGIYTGETIQLFWGGMIIVGAVILHFVRKKDWKKHWAEQEEFRLAMEEKQKKLKEKGENTDGN